MRYYKLTERDGTAYGGTPWGPGVRHEATGEGGLCSAGCIHCYDDRYLAALLNPIHGSFHDPICWLFEPEGEIESDDLGLKFGPRAGTTVKRSPLPRYSTEQRVTFAILCAKAVYSDEDWNAWADAWLSGEDRTRDAASAAAAVAAEWEAASQAEKRLAEVQLGGML